MASIPLILYILSKGCIPSVMLVLVLSKMLNIIPYRSKWYSFFSFKMWLVIISLILIFSFAMWQFKTSLNFDTGLLGFDWQWSAIITWGLLFISSFALARRKLEEIDAFALAWFLVILGSILYELPWHFATARFGFLYDTRFLINFMGFFLILRKYRFHLSENFSLTLIPLIINWLIFFSLPANCYWWPRLSVFPMFLFLSGSPINKAHNTENENRG